MAGPRITLVSALSARSPCGSGELPEYAPPLGVLALAALVRDRYPVHVLDLDELWWRSPDERSFSEIAFSAIRESHPDIIGFGSICGTYPRTMRMMERCAREIPDAVRITGGPHASVVDVATIDSFPFVDFILRGEADITFPVLIDALASDSSPAGICGLTWRSGGRTVRNPAAGPVADLDALPLPAYDLLPVVDALASLPIEAGRGCPYACRFCSTNDFFRRRFRLRSPQRVLDDMYVLNERYGVTSFDLVHDMFTVDPKRLAAFCERMIAEGSPFEWSCSARTDCVPAPLLNLMHEAGCRDIFFGTETGSARMQVVIDKHLDLDEARRALRNANDAGMMTTSSLIVGYPEETKEDLRETVRFFSDSIFIDKLHPLFNILTPLPETPMTTLYRESLTLDEKWEEISENGNLQEMADKELIRCSPEVFPNFYAFPSQVGREYLRCLRDFLTFGTIRCSGLMKAMYRLRGDLLAVYDTWEELRGRLPEAYYKSSCFVNDLIDFGASQYPEDTSVAVMIRFCRAASAADRNFARRNPPVPRNGRRYILLSEGVRLVDCVGDVNAVFRALREAKQPEPADIERHVTIVIRTTALNRSELFSFPAATVAVLRHAESGSAVEHVVRDFSAMFEVMEIQIGALTPDQIAGAAIAMLRDEGLIRVIDPDQPSSETTDIRASRVVPRPKKDRGAAGVTPAQVPEALPVPHRSEESRSSFVPAEWLSSSSPASAAAPARSEPDPQPAR